MKPGIELDFLSRERRAPRAGLALLGLGIALSAALGLQFSQLRAEIARLDTALSSSAAVVETRRPPAPEALADLKRAQGVLRRLAAPWNALFAEVEGAVGPNVALLGIQPDAAGARVTLNAEANSLREAVLFAERLNAGRVLSEAVLGGHAVRAQDPQRPVRFTVEARWLQAPQVRL